MDKFLSNNGKIEVVLKNPDNHAVDSEISLMDILGILIKGKWLIIFVVILSLLASIVYAVLLSPSVGSAHSIISFNFAGIEKGLDPYGKNFDVSLIKSPYVLEAVVEKLDLSKLGISTDYIRNSIEIKPLIPGDVNQRIKKLEEAKTENIKDLQSYVYFPNRYEIIVNVKKHSPITKELAAVILDETINEYRKYFYRTYSDMSVLSNVIGTIEYEEYDYPEISRVIHNQIDMIKNYLAVKLKEPDAESFRAKKTGLSMRDILESVSIIQDVDLSRMDSIIGAYNLTKDKEKLIKLYEYRIKVEELEKTKKNDEAQILSGVLDKYQKDKNMILMPGIAGSADGAGVLDFETTNEYYNQLSERYTNAGVQAANSDNDIAYYKKEIEKLKNDTVDVELKKIAEEDVNKLIPRIKEKLVNWINLTNETIEEFYDLKLNSGAITRLTPSEFSGSLGEKKMMFAIAMVIGLMVGVFTVFVRAYWASYKEAEKSGNVEYKRHVAVE